MSNIIDRRTDGGRKSIVNEDRFHRRYEKQIKEAVEKAVRERSITDESNANITIKPKRDLNEPTFRHGQGGIADRVYPGNKEFNEGDRFRRPSGGGGGAGKGDPSDQGEGLDDFEFTLSYEQILDILFSDCELPNLEKQNEGGAEEYERRRAGFSADGSPENRNLSRTFKAKIGRGIALKGNLKRRINELNEELENLPEDANEKLRIDIEERIKKLEEKLDKKPRIIENDLRFNNFSQEPIPVSKAVMFCNMDVSGSMTQETKDTAKRFYIMLYQFLKRNYGENVDVVFLKHHTHASECDEDDFFYGRETGGTIVSSVLTKMDEIIKERYPVNEWNIYGAQASDGDNWPGDSDTCVDILRNDLLPNIQGYFYIEIDKNGRHQDLWNKYQILQQEFPKTFAQQSVRSNRDIWPVFKEFFKKEGMKATALNDNKRSSASTFMKMPGLLG